MRVAIVSQGPSATLFAGNAHRRYDRVIGVNAMVRFWRCDFWAFNDAALFRATVARGTPLIWCKAAALSDVADSDPADLVRLLAGAAVRLHEIAGKDLYPLVPRWNLFSGLSALGLAVTLLPEAIDLYGYDMAGSNDAHGQDHPVRTPERWRTERLIFDALVQLAKSRGIVVRRISV